MTTVTESHCWFTSSYSDNGGDCVEVTANLASPLGIVPVRDSKRRDDGPVVAFPTTAWATFVSSLKQ